MGPHAFCVIVHQTIIEALVVDVIQVNAFNPGLRAAAIATANSIAAQCDGIRCDMAMLMLNDVFRRAWSPRAGRSLPTEYWQDLIPAIKARYPDVLFIAEAYWDLEYELIQKGFDYCYRQGGK